MSDIAQRIDSRANVDLLIQQWREAPRMRALAEALLGLVDDQIVKPLAELERMASIDTASGVWLDRIGERLGIRRPATDLGDFDYLGLSGSGEVGFDQGLFDTVNETLSPRLPVADALYRRLLMMRARVLMSDGSASDLEGSASRVFPVTRYRDNGDMTFDVLGYYLDPQYRHALAALNAVGGFPSPAGVSLSDVTWEHIVGGDCEGPESPVAANRTPSQSGVASYQQSDEQSRAGDHSWKIATQQGVSTDPPASVFVGEDVRYSDLAPANTLTFSAWVYVASGNGGSLDLEDVYLEIVCREVDDQGVQTFDNTESNNPTAFDSWERLEASTTQHVDCESLKFALRIDERSSAHVVYWDDISLTTSA